MLLLVGLKHCLINLAAVLLGALLFAGAHPNVLFANGLPFLAWIAYIPVFWLVNRTHIAATPFWGALYGYTAYALFNYWLAGFHPLAGLAVSLIYMAYFMLLFPLFKLSYILFPKKGYILQWLLWLSYEYIRTLGFLGYTYGITGYTQWQIIPLIQIADTLSVWGVSALVIFPSAYIAAFLRRGISIKNFLAEEKISAIAFTLALTGVLIYGLNAQVDYSDKPTRRIALIQHNTDPWIGGLPEYRRNFEILRRLSDEAIAQNPKPDLVVWSETAFIPRIYWHINYRGSPDSFALVMDLMNYLATQEVPFIIGNDDSRKDPAINPRTEEDYRVNYNAALLFERGKLVDQYRKVHLVPFTETFPFERQFPHIYSVLRSRDDIHLWEAGKEFNVLETGGFRFGTPICFEDTFGYISRIFVQNGAELLVNLTNDAWSQSLSAQMQRMSIAVFRSVENRRSTVRSTSSGQTSGIDPNGRVIAMANAFEEVHLTVEVPIVNDETRYTRYGDFFAVLCVVGFIFIFIIGITVNIVKKVKSSQESD